MESKKFAEGIHESLLQLLAVYQDAGGDLQKLSGGVKFLHAVHV